LEALNGAAAVVEHSSLLKNKSRSPVRPEKVSLLLICQTSLAASGIVQKFWGEYCNSHGPFLECYNSILSEPISEPIKGFSLQRGEKLR
jgi:hypothetical protein